MLVKLRGFEKELKDIGKNEIELVVDKVYSGVENYIIKGIKIGGNKCLLECNRYQKIEAFKLTAKEELGSVAPLGYDFLTHKVEDDVIDAMEKEDFSCILKCLLITVNGNDYITFLGKEDEVEVYGDEKNFICRY